MQHDSRASDVLKRPEITYAHLQSVAELELPKVKEEIALQVEIISKYAGYIDRQKTDIARMLKHEDTKIPDTFDYSLVSSLSNEVVQKLTSIKPATIAQAGRISGITPAALSLLLVHLKKQRALS